MGARDDQRTFLMGQRVGLSFLDTKLANLAYRCGEKCNSQIVCENEGYVNQYCQCTCPDGFSGERCQSLQGFTGEEHIHHCLLNAQHLFIDDMFHFSL